MLLAWPYMQDLARVPECSAWSSWSKVCITQDICPSGPGSAPHLMTALGLMAPGQASLECMLHAALLLASPALDCIQCPQTLHHRSQTDWSRCHVTCSSRPGGWPGCHWHWNQHGEVGSMVCGPDPTQGAFLHYSFSQWDQMGLTPLL